LYSPVQKTVSLTLALNKCGTLNFFLKKMSSYYGVLILVCFMAVGGHRFVSQFLHYLNFAFTFSNISPKMWYIETENCLENNKFAHNRKNDVFERTALLKGIFSITLKTYGVKNEGCLTCNFFHAALLLFWHITYPWSKKTYKNSVWMDLPNLDVFFGIVMH
jgi:hypothetical protein